jgi:hypothetical protein
VLEGPASARTVAPLSISAVLAASVMLLGARHRRVVLARRARVHDDVTDREIGAVVVEAGCAVIAHPLHDLERAVIARHALGQRDLHLLHARQRRRVRDQAVREHREHGRIHDRNAPAVGAGVRGDRRHRRQLAAVRRGERHAEVARVVDGLAEADRDRLTRLVRGDRAGRAARPFVSARRGLLRIAQRSLFDPVLRLLEEEVRGRERRSRRDEEASGHTPGDSAGGARGHRRAVSHARRPNRTPPCAHLERPAAITARWWWAGRRSRGARPCPSRSRRSRG